MSLQAHLSKLQQPLQDLVNNATQDDDNATGKSQNDQTQVVEWIEKVVRGEFLTPASLKNLESVLVAKTYLVSNYLTAADVALYGALHPILSQAKPAEYYSHPALTRYFDHIQSRPAVRKVADALASPLHLVSFDLDNAPQPKHIAGQIKNKVPEPAAEASNPTTSQDAGKTVTTDVDTARSATRADGKVQRKDKEKTDTVVREGASKKGSGAAKASGTEDSKEPLPSMIDLRVGQIVDIKKHPDADGLYIEKIDLGEEAGPRTVVSGLVNYIPIEKMRNAYLVAVCNLKPATFRGVKSFAMVLCAVSKDGKDAGMELIQPPVNAKPGDRIYFEGAGFEDTLPLSQLSPKRKIFETIQPGFITLDTKEAAWINPTTKSVHKIRTKDGVCAAPTLVGASLS